MRRSAAPSEPHLLVHARLSVPLSRVCGGDCADGCAGETTRGARRYVTNAAGEQQLIYMDEVGTPDSSRIWDGEAYREGKVVENSKEGFRKMLQAHFPDPDILLNKKRMAERYPLAEDNELPVVMMQAVSETYVGLAEKITGKPLPLSTDPRSEIIAVLRDGFGLVD